MQGVLIKRGMPTYDELSTTSFSEVHILENQRHIITDILYRISRKGKGISVDSIVFQNTQLFKCFHRFHKLKTLQMKFMTKNEAKGSNPL
ncbi:hypothetical protein D3C76_1412240 [compost metagenome]